MSENLSPPLSHDQISQYDKMISAAQAKANELRNSLPALPKDEELGFYEGRMWAVDRRLIDAVRRHFDIWGVGYRHQFEEHPAWVAKVSAYVADKECEERQIRGELRDEVIKRAWRLGLLHDLQRWRGFSPVHQIEGLKAGRQILEELGIKDDYLEDQILLHDQKVVKPRNDPRFDIPFFSVFAVDHLRWGTEWEKNKWETLRMRKVPPEEAIHDYDPFMQQILDGPNLQQTVWGRKVAVPYIQFGISIAKHVEEIFEREAV